MPRAGGPNGQNLPERTLHGTFLRLRNAEHSAAQCLRCSSPRVRASDCRCSSRRSNGRAAQGGCLSVHQTEGASAASVKRAVTMEKLVNLCKRRGIVFPASEIYGGLGSTWDYGPLGIELKRNVKAE